MIARQPGFGVREAGTGVDVACAEFQVIPLKTRGLGDAREAANRDYGKYGKSAVDHA
jgi:hypothetical protein